MVLDLGVTTPGDDVGGPTPPRAAHVQGARDLSLVASAWAWARRASASSAFPDALACSASWRSSAAAVSRALRQLLYQPRICRAASACVSEISQTRFSALETAAALERQLAEQAKASGKTDEAEARLAHAQALATKLKSLAP